MVGRVSALAVLGLGPGADKEAVEEAYKRLIKQYHPDRHGGDSGRAAEINHAYRELRSAQAVGDPLEFNDVAGKRQRPRWPLAAVVGGAILGALFFVLGPSAPGSAFWPATMPVASQQTGKHETSDDSGAAIDTRAIDEAVITALRLYRHGDEMALAAESQRCQQRFRNNPSAHLLDRCSAFDDAVVGLQDRDPLRDRGPFAPLAVTGRQWSAASLLSNDSLAIDSRLDQIRLRVELALAPHVAPIAPATGNISAD